MQRKTTNEIKIGDSVIPFPSVGKSSAVDKTTSDFDNANLKMRNFRRLIERRIYNADIARYILGTMDLVFEGNDRKNYGN